MEHRVPSSAQRQRLLAAIMVTDAVGFSTRMSVDEGLTLRLIDRDLALIAEVCQEFGGTVLKSTGDGLLMYFLSAVEAVSCGLEIQHQLVNLGLGPPPEQGLEHRVGIHLGDILIGEQDVMGNGVNITARLQAHAKPQGLCVSQAIYDLVKARLSLQATFLGPLHLKNIQAPVPAYQLTRQAAGADHGLQTSGEPTCTLPMTTDALLNLAIRGLTTNPQSGRIKKLVFATYQQAWENDQAVLDQFDLRALLVALRARYPSLEDLDRQLQHIVMGLNRQPLYAAVAATILHDLQAWYSRSPEPHPEPWEATRLTLPTLEQRCQTLAEHLSHHPESLRLRKLLYCLGHSAWENNTAVLDQIDLSQLLQQVLIMAPQRKDLRYHLGRIVKRLNRQAEYTRMADQLMAVMQPLYLGQSALDQPDVDQPKPPDPPGQPDPPNSNPMASPQKPISKAKAPMAEATMVTPVRLTLEGHSPGDITTLHSALSDLGQLSLSPAQAEENLRPPQDCSSLFDLRVGIIQYANPLRVKILLYSCLHGPFGYTAQDWSMLRQQPLDQLLHQVLAYCPTFSDLQSKLTIIAHCLTPADENIQVASTLVQAMKAYYPANPETPLVLTEGPQFQRGKPPKVETGRPQPDLRPSPPPRLQPDP